MARISANTVQAGTAITINYKSGDNYMQLPSLIEIPNGEKVIPTFSDSEMKDRLARLRDYLAKENIEAVVL